MFCLWLLFSLLFLRVLSLAFQCVLVFFNILQISSRSLQQIHKFRVCVRKHRSIGMVILDRWWLLMVHSWRQNDWAWPACFPASLSSWLRPAQWLQKMIKPLILALPDPTHSTLPLGIRRWVSKLYGLYCSYWRSWKTVTILPCFGRDWPWNRPYRSRFTGSWWVGWLPGLSFGGLDWVIICHNSSPTRNQEILRRFHQNELQIQHRNGEIQNHGLDPWLIPSMFLELWL